MTLIEAWEGGEGVALWEECPYSTFCPQSSAVRLSLVKPALISFLPSCAGVKKVSLGAPTPLKVFKLYFLTAVEQSKIANLTMLTDGQGFALAVLVGQKCNFFDRKE